MSGDAKEKTTASKKRAAAGAGTTKGGGGKSSGLGAAGSVTIANGEDVVFHMTKAIHNIASKRDAYVKSITDFQDVEKEIELRIMANKKRMDEQESLRNKEMAELEAEVERQRKRRRIDLEQDLREFGSQQVQKLLAEAGKVAIAAEELAQLREDLAMLRKSKDEAVRAATQELNEKSRAELASRLETMQLKHAAEIAALTAQRDQQQQQIKVLQETINSTRTECDRQRELTRDVAYSQQRVAAPAPTAAPPASYRG